MFFFSLCSQIKYVCRNKGRSKLHVTEKCSSFHQHHFLSCFGGQHFWIWSRCCSVCCLPFQNFTCFFFKLQTQIQIHKTAIWKQFSTWTYISLITFQYFSWLILKCVLWYFTLSLFVFLHKTPKPEMRLLLHLMQTDLTSFYVTLLSTVYWLVSLGTAHPHTEVFKTNSWKQWFALCHQVINTIIQIYVHCLALHYVNSQWNQGNFKIIFT